MRRLWKEGLLVLGVVVIVFAAGFQFGGKVSTYEDGGAQLAKDYKEATYARAEKGLWLGAVGQAVYQGGSTYLLFLVDTGTDYHWTTGAWQGGFCVQEGRVWSQYELGESEGSPLVTKGASLDSVLDTLMAACPPGK